VSRGGTNGGARSGGAIRLVGLEKSFDGTPAVAGIDLDVHPGEFFSLLGPSGCGKTTTLRMIAGFEQPTAGAVMLDGQDLVAVPPHRRPVNTVFQSYALFPFLDVWRNVAFGLRYQKVPKGEKDDRVRQALAMVQMEDFARRRPAQLSGGQQQRVALARALVLNPSVLLLDEPLGALDAQLRKRLQLELKALQESLGVTFVYVTHDQDEALTMSDRLAVMRAGRVEQVGTPEEVYSAPESAYVASFLGSANVLDVEVVDHDGETASVRLGTLTMRVTGPAAPGRAKVVVRPECVTVGPADGGPAGDPGAPGTNVFTDPVDRVVHHGPTTHVTVRLADGQSLLASVPNSGGVATAVPPSGAPARTSFTPEAARVLGPAVEAVAAAEASPVDEPDPVTPRG
jgi:spermidine/putrescine transport system ATP-binding protein